MEKYYYDVVLSDGTIKYTYKVHTFTEDHAVTIAQSTAIEKNKGIFLVSVKKSADIQTREIGINRTISIKRV